MIKVGDRVVPRSSGNPLRSGGCGYAYAIVARLEPFCMMSSDADMSWTSTYKAEDVLTVGQADAAERVNVALRCKKDGIDSPLIDDLLMDEKSAKLLASLNDIFNGDLLEIAAALEGGYLDGGSYSCASQLGKALERFVKAKIAKR